MSNGNQSILGNVINKLLDLDNTVPTTSKIHFLWTTHF